MARELDVLGEVAEAALKGGRFINADTLRARLDEPWLIDDLMRSGDIALNAGRGLVPTIAGLRRLATPVAQGALDSLRRLHELLRSSYIEDAQTVDRSAATLGQQLQLPEALVARLLSIWHASTKMSSISATGSWAGGFTNISLAPGVVTEDPFASSSAEDPPGAFGGTTITARDFRVLDMADWAPSGVCLLAGPNGSGKSSLLEVLMFLRDIYVWGLGKAVGLHRGADRLRRSGAVGPPEVLVGVQVADLRWTLRLSVIGGGIGEFPGEEVTRNGKVLVRRSASAPEWYLGRERLTNNIEGRPCLRMALDSGRVVGLEPLIKVIEAYVAYANYRLDVLRDGGSGSAGDSTLAPDGQNLFHVLLSWKTASRRFQNRFEWVEQQLKKAFPGIIERIEFGTPIGKVVPAHYFRPDSTEDLPMSSAADGLLVGLLHLTAVAGAGDGGIIAIDELENHLHPFAIRSILASMRALAEERNLTVLITSHSPVVMNGFRDDPAQVYVMERSDASRSLPSVITDLHSEEWLAQAKLGTLYDQLAFGSPKDPAANR